MVCHALLIVRAIRNLCRPRLRKYCTDTPKKKWRIMFFGTDNFALRSLQQLHQAMQEGRTVSALSVVVPQPKPHPCLVAKYAQQHQLPVSTWPLPKTGWTGEPSRQWDLGVVASFGHLIPNRVINTFPKGMLNVHASLLPRWRGAAPIIHAIMNGDTESGVTLMLIKPFHFDVGDIVLQQRVPIHAQVTAKQFTAELAETGADLLERCVADLDAHLSRSYQQPSKGITLAPKIDTQLAVVDWSSLSATQVYNRWRATVHLFKLQTTFHGESVKLDEVHPPDTINSLETNFQPGYIRVDRSRNLLLVRCRVGWISFSRITIPKRPSMSPSDFYNGYLSKRPSHEHLFTVS